MCNLIQYLAITAAGGCLPKNFTCDIDQPIATFQKTE